ISRFGKNTSAYTGKQGLSGSTHAKGKHCGSDDHHVVSILGSRVNIIQDDKPQGNIEQSQTYHYQTHYRSASESDLQTGVQRFSGRVGCSGRSHGGGFHTQVTGHTGKETSREKCERHPWVLKIEAICQHRKKCSKQHKKDEHYLVLLLQVSHGSLAYVRSYFFHNVGSFFCFPHLPVKMQGKKQGQQRGRRNNPKYVVHCYIDKFLTID